MNDIPDTAVPAESAPVIRRLWWSVFSLAGAAVMAQGVFYVKGYFAVDGAGSGRLAPCTGSCAPADGVVRRVLGAS